MKALNRLNPHLSRFLIVFGALSTLLTLLIASGGK